jgi:hypothetical protein
MLKEYLMNYRKYIAVLSGVAAMLVGCGGGDGSSASAGTSDSITTSSVAPDFPNLKACVTNNWFMSSDQLLRGVQALGSGSGVNFTATGSQTAAFSSDATYRNTYLDFTVNFTSGSTSGTSRYAGSVGGTWSVDGDWLTITQTSSSATVTTTIAGVSSTTPVPIGAPSTLKVISCTPATLTYDQTLSTGAVVRIVLVTG